MGILKRIDTLGCGFSRGTSLESFVVTSVVQLLCRTTKLCWYDDDAFRNIVEDAKQFLDKVRLCYSLSTVFAAFLLVKGIDSTEVKPPSTCYLCQKCE